MDGKKLVSYTIEVHDCFFCSETVFENIDIPYCTPNAGVFEHLYNLKSIYQERFDPRLIRIDAVKSAKYDGDTCEYQLTVIE